MGTGEWKHAGSRPLQRDTSLDDAEYLEWKARCSEELLSEARLLHFVPIVRLRHVILSLGREKDALNNHAPAPAALFAPTCDLTTDRVAIALCDAATQHASLQKPTGLRLLERCYPISLRRAEGVLRD